MASDLNFAHLIDAHVKSGANVTMVYERAEIAKPITTDNYTFTMDDAGRVTEIRWNDYRMGVQNLSMGVIVMDREELIAMVKDAAVQNRMYLERDILGPSLKILHVQGYEYSGYRARIYDIKSYFDENMRLLCGKCSAAVPHRAPCIHQGARRGPCALRHGLPGTPLHRGGRLHH